MRLGKSIIIGLQYFYLTFFSEQLFAKEYWVLPALQASEYCTKKSCSCSEIYACALNNTLLKSLNPGDSVIFNKGAYSSFIIDNLHGTAEKPIIFKGALGLEKSEVSLNPNHQLDLIEIKKSSHITLTDFSVYHSPRAGIRVNNSHNIILKNNILSDNGVWGIFTNHSNDFTATNNTIIGPAQQHGIYHSNSGDNVKINANFIKGFNGCAIHVNGDTSMGGAPKVKADGIISNVEITNNYLSSNGAVGGSAINLDGVVDGSIENNLLVNNKAAAISIFKEDGAVGSTNINVVNNLVIMAKGARWAVNIKNSGGNNLFENNIMISQDSFRGVYDVFPINLKTNNKYMPFSAQNNQYAYGRNLLVLNDKYYLTLNDWQQKFENDLQSSRFHYKNIFSSHGKLSLPITKLVREKNIAVLNPYLPLLL